MMWYSHGDLGWPGWTLMLLSMAAFWGLVIWGIWALTRVGSGTRTDVHTSAPEQVLAHRFAAGEIDADTYRHALGVLSERNGAHSTP